MIIDTLSSFHRYIPVHPLFAVVADYMEAHDLAAMGPGRFDIGRGIRIGIDDYTTRPSEEKKAEYHNSFIDIQMLLSGCETFGYCSRKLCSEHIPYDVEKDVGFMKGELDLCKLRPGFFVVFFPEDVHMPGLHADGLAGRVRKVVVKVPCNAVR